MRLSCFRFFLIFVGIIFISSFVVGGKDEISLLIVLFI